MKLFPLAVYRKWLLGVIALTGAVFGVFYLINNKDFLNLANCDFGTLGCMDKVEIFDAFYSGFFLKLIILSAFLLLFFPERAFKWWRWFALIAVPLLSWWIIVEDAEYFGHRTASNFSGIGFFAVSLLISLSASVFDFIKKRGEKISKPVA